MFGADRKSGLSAPFLFFLSKVEIFRLTNSTSLFCPICKAHGTQGHVSPPLGGVGKRAVPNLITVCGQNPKAGATEVLPQRVQCLMEETALFRKILCLMEEIRSLLLESLHSVRDVQPLSWKRLPFLIEFPV